MRIWARTVHFVGAMAGCWGDPAAGKAGADGTLAKAPDAKGADTTTPGATTPDAKTLDATTLDATTLDAKVPDAKPDDATPRNDAVSPPTPSLV